MCYAGKLIEPDIYFIRSILASLTQKHQEEMERVKSDGVREGRLYCQDNLEKMLNEIPETSVGALDTLNRIGGWIQIERNLIGFSHPSKETKE
jgi:ribosomal 50S subunit-associated protein YjgA (DUF615 family)